MSVISAYGRVTKHVASLAVEIILASTQTSGVIARAVSGTIGALFVLTLIAVVGRKAFATCSQRIAKAVAGAVRRGVAENCTVLIIKD